MDCVKSRLYKIIHATQSMGCRTVKRKVFMGGLMAGILFVTGCLSIAEGDVDEILAKMRKAMDPEGLSSKIITQVVTSRLDSSRIKDGNMVVEIKYPDEMRIKLESKDGVFLKGCNGKTGWEFSTRKGLREIHGMEFNNLKFQIIFLSPKAKYKEIFESITIAGVENVKKQPCYKLVCKPMPTYGMESVCIYVDQKTYLVEKTEETHIGPNDEPIEVTRYFLDYEKTGGVFFPMKIISEADGRISELSVESVEWNEDLSENSFDVPDEIK